MKKKIICFLMCLSTCFVLSGCKISQDMKDYNESVIGTTWHHTICEFVDPDTGVHYLYHSSEKGGITPRLNKDGSVMTTD